MFLNLKKTIVAKSLTLEFYNRCRKIEKKLFYDAPYRLFNFSIKLKTDLEQNKKY